MAAGPSVERKRKGNLTMFADLWLSGSQHEVITPPTVARTYVYVSRSGNEYPHVALSPRIQYNKIHFFHLLFFFTLLTMQHGLPTSDDLMTDNRAGMGRESGTTQPDDMQTRTPSYNW